MQETIPEQGKLVVWCRERNAYRCEPSGEETQKEVKAIITADERNAASKWSDFSRIVVRMLLVRRVACYLTPVRGRGRRCGAWRQGRP
jgi:hypothetical protein